MTLTDEQFLQMFENCTLKPESFGHYGHLRLAWLYLNNYSLETAIDKVTRGIAKYAGSLGATDKFHHTLTEAIVRIMAERMRAGEANSLDAYLANNPDLLENIQAVVASYYSGELLNSKRARIEFLPPDRRPLCAVQAA